MDELQKIMGVLLANKDKSFVQRILRPTDFPVLQEGDNVATHKMSWGEENGKFYVYPQVLLFGDRLIDAGEGAWDHAMQTGNFIEFPSAEDADWFSKNYKRVWEKHD